ncbi:MAG: cell division protein ZapE [Pseudomonadales bacterium]|nr:cell division protein ZapE [Pseudomonadales bacterium]NIX06906.1 cell division protein ZapE [Pseudomonadales bacterium]
MSPLQKYEEQLTRSGFFDDPAQREVAGLLDELHRAVMARERQHASRMRRALRMVSIGTDPEPVNGLYLWGTVGRGKTLLMDLFYECLPEDVRLRMHFHRFMQRVHRQLTSLSGTPNPLQKVAEGFAGEARVLCFDEFAVSDIGDAMILAELLAALFQRGVTLVATSNVEPDNLYENGLQRRRFLPAIELIRRHTLIHEVGGDVDYRLRVLERAEIYHVPLDAGAERSLAQSFDALAPEAPQDDVDLEIEGRMIRVRRVAEDVAWFDFADLCEGPRSQNDYIELSRIFHAVLISGVPRFNTRSEDAARRFISLVDEFYDHGVKLIVSAEAEPAALYGGERLRFEFERTVSRLLEMQSHDYLARSHRA